MSQKVNDITYEQWKQKLIDITVRETGTPAGEIRINDDEAKQWFTDGLDAYFCFRENWKG